MADRSATRLSDWPAGPHPSCNGRFVVSRRRYSLLLSLSHSVSLSPLHSSVSLRLSLSLSRSLSTRVCTLQPRSFNNPVNRDSTVPTYLPIYPFPLHFFLLFFLSRNLSLLPSLPLFPSFFSVFLISSNRRYLYRPCFHHFFSTFDIVSSSDSFAAFVTCHCFRYLSNLRRLAFLN